MNKSKIAQEPVTVGSTIVDTNLERGVRLDSKLPRSDLTTRSSSSVSFFLLLGFLGEA